MKLVTTYAGLDAHKKDLFIAMPIGNEPKPVTRHLANEPNRSVGWCESSSVRQSVRSDSL